jgi:ribosome-associated protein
MSSSYIEVELNHQPIELCKLLKIANLVGGGGEAKMVISEGYVLLNGEVEYQKRKKVYHEDVIEFNGEVVQLIINDTLDIVEADEAKNQPSSPPDNTIQTKPEKAQKKNKTNKAVELEKPETSLANTPKKRKPIAF